MKKSRFLSTLISAVLIGSCLPFSEMIAQAGTISGTCNYGENGAKWIFNYSTGVLTYSDGEYASYINSDSSYWNKDSVYSVVYGEGIKEIWGLKGYSNLTSVSLPSTLETIECTSFGGCFEECSSIRSIVIPDGVTLIDYSTFKNCTNLSSITLPANLESIEKEAFEYCTFLKQITLPDKLEFIGNNAFEESGLTSIDIPDSVTVIGERAFANCENLKSVTLPDNGIHFRDRAFVRTGLTSVDIPPSVLDTGKETFSNCADLASVTIGDGVMTVGNSCFSYCRSLTSITIPASVTTIEKDAFAYCDNLKDITILNPECVISSLGINDLTIHGYTGSTAQTYADNHSNINFVPLDDSPVESTLGDVNDDGSFGVSDVVMLNKWLLAVPDVHLNNWKAADFNNDNKLDVFDLILMKSALIESNQTNNE